MKPKDVIWLKAPRPGKGPPSPGHVDIDLLRRQANALAARGMTTAAMEYLDEKGPKINIDKWGRPLPLCRVDQDRLNRLFAIMAAPFERGWALVVSGQLSPAEVDAIQYVAPEVWVVMRDRIVHDMIEAGPPFPSWVVAQLDVFFGESTATVFETAQGDVAAQELGQSSGGGRLPLPGPHGTPADRRELAVREERR